MNHETAVQVRRPLAVVAAAALAAGSVLTATAAGAAPLAADAPASTVQTARFEVDFLKDMIDHHTMATMMAETCVAKATHSELRGMCESIIESQSAQVDLMQGWLDEWYGIGYEPQMSRGDMRAMNRLESLSGAEFEIAFMRSMVRHHWAALQEARVCLLRAEHPDLLSLCEDIRAEQVGEIAQLQAWLEQWYDRPGGRPARTA
ncbi:DUF305 domain-containing protein [Cellulomonas fimi]|uniref:DUF305 domain-containing protein n=1 Tax=Cellulomonas fimi TaxID=1708 RepID=A0A7Y0M0L4_CELFI|nr:DUF305 domain-containing protein [Cellulomonas fimi]NMR21565.1 DUF305 domain-containing protein [Cellulomonas fimi]